MKFKWTLTFQNKNGLEFLLQEFSRKTTVKYKTFVFLKKIVVFDICCEKKHNLIEKKNKSARYFKA